MIDELLYHTTNSSPNINDVIIKKIFTNEYDISGPIVNIETNIPVTVSENSPMGMWEFGYLGSGCLDFALNILNYFIPPNTDNRSPVQCNTGYASWTAYKLHRAFALEFLVKMRREGEVIPGVLIKYWLDEQIKNITS